MLMLNYYHVEISDGTGIMRRAKNEFTRTEYRVIGENDINLVIDNLHFTTVRKNKSKYHSPCLDHPSICLNFNDSVWGNRITYHLYTFNTKKASIICKEIEKKIQKEFGFFIGKLDLSAIKD